jgi:hypothetical protein
MQPEPLPKNDLTDEDPVIAALHAFRQQRARESGNDMHAYTRIATKKAVELGFALSMPPIQKN